MKPTNQNDHNMKTKAPKRENEFYVYAIKVKESVLKVETFMEANPKYQSGKDCYYVGQSSKTPEMRARIHRTRGKNKKGVNIFSKICHDHYDGLVPVLFKHLNPLSSRDAARVAELRLAKDLREQGCSVWMGKSGKLNL